MSREGFLRRGETIECLKDDGKLPEDSERLTIRVMVGRRTGRHFLRSQVGIGSRSHCLFGDIFMSLRISTSVAGVNEEKSGGRDGGGGKCGLVVLDGVKARRSLSILSVKKDANESGRDLVGEEEGRECLTVR